MMRRAVTCVVLLAAATGLPAQDVLDIVRRAVELDRRDSQSAPRYSYLQRQETRELDHSGQVKGRKIETWNIVWIEGSPYRRLVGRNDQPLSAEEQKAEEDRLHRNSEQRRMETGEQRARRLGEWQRRQERQREPVKEVPDAFNFTRLPDEQVDGRPMFRIDAAPKAGYKPKAQMASAIFPNVKLHMWIDKRDYQGARIDMEVLEPISFIGFLLKLSKGSRLRIEQAPVDDGVWLPKQVLLTAAARILLLKGLNRELDFNFSDYKKVSGGATAVAFAEKP
ncbi:MAG TPA: hypothetical protein VKT49_23045 [Bryobacteraceae bacterium]|nr:hypothetical protein [Bryobacteraceae bacterium]